MVASTHSHWAFIYTGITWDEENWRSQYGQVIQSEEEPVLAFPVINLWDWAVVMECRKDGRDQVTRLVGHLVSRSVKLHPSMPSGGHLLKTAPIHEVHLDLVQVTTGLDCLYYKFTHKVVSNYLICSGFRILKKENTFCCLCKIINLCGCLIIAPFQCKIFSFPVKLWFF